MNEAIDTTAEPVFARTAISVGAIHAEVERMWSQSRDLQMMSNLLMSDVEQALLIGRGRLTDDGTIVLMFQERDIDVTLWLVGKLWGEAEELEGKLAGLMGKLEALA